jgi:glycosyltransferase involved in cell wall biosynthesis
VDAPSPALAAARRLARRAACPILPVDDTVPADLAGRVLLVDHEPGEALLAALAAALPQAEALVLWVAGWDPSHAADALGRHGFEHGTVSPVAMPVAGVLAVLTHDEARAELHAAELARRERPFRALAIMPAYNEADVIEPAIGALIAEGVDVYLLDHRSTDATVAVSERWLGRGLVRIERFPDESGGFDARNEDQMVWRDILRRVEQVGGEVAADWYLFVNADEFRESPWPGTTLADGLREVDELGYSAVNFDLVNFRPTPQDAFPDGADVREHLRFYEPPGVYDVVQVKAWKGQDATVDLASRGGHDVLFPGRRIFPIPFILRHYPIRSAEHGIRKVRAERLARFAAEERANGWHVQYDHYDDGADYLHERDTLTAWNGDRFRAELLARASRQHLLLGAVRGFDLAAPDLPVAGLIAWMARRGHGELTGEDLARAHAHVREGTPAGPDLEAVADDLDALLEAHARTAGQMEAAAGMGRARELRRPAA